MVCPPVVAPTNGMKTGNHARSPERWDGTALPSQAWPVTRGGDVAIRYHGRIGEIHGRGA
jgi:hypothetical protein